MTTQNYAEEEALLAIRDGVKNGHDEIVITIHPHPRHPASLSIRVRRGPSKIFEVATGT